MRENFYKNIPHLRSEIMFSDFPSIFDSKFSNRRLRLRSRELKRRRERTESTKKGMSALSDRRPPLLLFDLTKARVCFGQLLLPCLLILHRRFQSYLNRSRSELYQIEGLCVMAHDSTEEETRPRRLILISPTTSEHPPSMLPRPSPTADSRFPTS